MTKGYYKFLIPLSIILALALSVVSVFGAFVPGTYEGDADSMAAQGMGQDLVNLILVLPLLVTSLFFLLKGSRRAFYIYGGSVFYLLYSFVVYTFGVHFNAFFLLYCLVLGLSVYGFILLIWKGSSLAVEDWYDEKSPVKTMAVYLLAVAGLFYMIWLKEVVPAILNHTVPLSVSTNDLLVNPVHVLDLAIALPGVIITALLLWRKRRLGYILAPMVLIFVIILAIALVAMMVVLKVKGISEDLSIGFIFIILAVISTGFLFGFLRRLKKED